MWYIHTTIIEYWASLVAQTVKCLPAMRETQVQFLGWEDPLEKEMAIHSSTLAWKILWMEEPDRLQSTGLQRVRHDWVTSLTPETFRIYYISVSHYDFNALQVISSLFFLFWFSHYVYATPKCPMWSEVTQSCPTLCDPMDCSLSGSSVHGIFQARVLEWVSISFSRGSSWLRDQTRVSRIVGRHFTVWATREVQV